MLDLPKKLAQYQILGRIALGGMAEVYKAVSRGVEGFEKVVAIKRILPHVAEDEEFITMFKDEARIAAQLQHSNIAQIYELKSEGETFYIVLEYVPGKDLRAIFEHGRTVKRPMPLAQACYVIMQVCEGLEYAHNKKDRHQRPLGLIHRDVSPPNVLVSYEGEVKLIDFGVAKAAGRASQTQAGILKGKFGYMSPEQVRGATIDRRSDVFSLGAVLWEILCNQRLFQAETDFATLEKVRTVNVDPPSRDQPGGPEQARADCHAGARGRFSTNATRPPRSCTTRSRRSCSKRGCSTAARTSRSGCKSTSPRTSRPRRSRAASCLQPRRPSLPPPGTP